MTSPAALEATLAELRNRVDRYAPSRYPVQHATARFHLGVTLLQGGHPAQAVAELGEAVALFRSSGMAVEHAKASMMLGVSLREDGRLDEAEQALEAAAAAFSSHDQTGEHAAALHNLGMVARDRGDLEQAVVQFAAAAESFDVLGQRQARTAADREAGTTHLALGRPDQAVAPLQRAMDEAGQRGDAVGWGAAANALGLAHLALDDHTAAEAAFRAAVSAAPRSVRPESYSMAKANLALAHEHAGAQPLARLAARQARDVPGAPETVVAQAAGVLERLAGGPDDLALVLDDEQGDAWAAVLRDEMGRWADTDDDERQAAAAGWVEGVLGRRDRATELLCAWLDAVLELPPEAMERVLGATVAAWAQQQDAEREAFRSLTSRVLPRFHLPQWQRLQAAFERHSAAAGEAAAWR